MLFARCPVHELEGSEFEVLRMWTLLRNHKTWPAAGGIDDQAAWFVDAVTFLDSEGAAFKVREQKRMSTNG